MCVLGFPFASDVFAAFRRALLVITKRRRNGAVLALLRRSPLRDALDAAVFRFNIIYKTRTIRFSSEKFTGDFCFADCGDPELFTRPLALESWILRTPEDRRGFILAGFAGKSSIIVTLSSLLRLMWNPSESRVDFKLTILKSAGCNSKSAPFTHEGDIAGDLLPQFRR